MNTPYSTTSVSLKELSRNLSNLAQLESDIFSSSPDRKYLEEVKRWGQGEFRLVVMGEIKQGKSSFINALLGYKDLVPVNSDVATSTIFKIRYGISKSYRVFFTQESGKPDIAITERDLHDYGTENGNPNNQREVDFIEVCVPSPLLETGIVIVDTPGLGGLVRKHKEITYRFVPQADAVFFVTESVGSPLGLKEINFLKEIKSITNNIYFVQTKATDADPQTREAREKNNKEILINQAGFKQEDISYFTVDSNLKLESDESNDREDLEDSGFPPLQEFLLNHLLRIQHQLIAERAMIQTRPKLERVKRKLVTKKALLNAETEEQQKKLGVQLQNAQSDFERWNSKEKPLLLSDIDATITSIRNNAHERLQMYQSGGQLHQKYKQQIEHAQNLKQLAATFEDIVSEFPWTISQVAMDTSRMIQQKAETKFSQIAHKSSLKISGNVTPYTPSLNTAGLRQQVEKFKKGVSLGDTAIAFTEGAATGSGGSWGKFIGKVAGWLVDDPSTGEIIGEWVGRGINGLLSCFDVEEKKLGSNKQEALRTISDALSSAYSQTLSSIDSIMRKIQDDTNRAIKTWVLETQADFKRQIATLNERKNMSDQDLMKKREKLSIWETRLQQIERELPLE